MRKHLGMKVTAVMLKRHGACKEQVDRFRKRFPKGVRITQKEAEKKFRGWNWHWAGRKLLNAAGRAEYERLHEQIIAMRTHYIWSRVTENGVSSKAILFSEASVFGGLAEQKRYDPAYTPG